MAYNVCRNLSMHDAIYFVYILHCSTVKPNSETTYRFFAIHCIQPQLSILLWKCLKCKWCRPGNKHNPSHPKAWWKRWFSWWIHC